MALEHKRSNGDIGSALNARLDFYAKGDMLEFELDSVSGMSACTVSLGVRRLP